MAEKWTIRAENAEIPSTVRQLEEWLQVFDRVRTHWIFQQLALIKCGGQVSTYGSVLL